MVMLDVRNLYVRYGDLEILHDVSFSVESGQWLMIVGPNGAGKSTIANAISGSVPYEGEIRCLGKDVKDYKPREFARNVGFLSQRYHVSYPFTVAEIVRLGRYAYTSGILSRSSDEDEAAIMLGISKGGLQELKNRSAMTLSGGELQRTFLAQLYAQRPKLLILDEPTNHLDLIYQKQVFKHISIFLEQPDRAVVSIVHDISFARAFGTKVLLLHQGKRVSFGDPQEALSLENLKRVYEMDVFEWMNKLYRSWKV